MAEASADPDALVIGIDAVAQAMVESSRRAARSLGRGGRPNALFLVAGVESLTPEIDAIAQRVTIRFPWGSLLAGALGFEPVASKIAALVAPGGSLELGLSITGRDGNRVATGRLEPLDVAGIADRFGRLGLQLVENRPIDSGELDRLASTWARRLRVGSDRPARWVRFVRA
jgi:hypothetical protein